MESLTYETELTPEETIELLYKGSGRWGRSYCESSKKYLAGCEGKGEANEGGSPYYKRVWYPAETKDANVIPRTRKKPGEVTAGSNLTMILAAFGNEASGHDKGISAKQFNRALSSLACDSDKDLVKTYYIFHPSDSTGNLPYSKLAEGLDTLINKAGKSTVSNAAFSLFANLGGRFHFSGTTPATGFDSNSYIHLHKLLDLRKSRSLDGLAPRTCHMLKVLIHLFDEGRKLEEERFLASMGKSKKGKSKKPPAMSPLRLMDEMRDFHRTRHMDIGEFLGHLETNPDMVRAFLPVALKCLLDDPSLIE